MEAYEAIMQMEKKEPKPPVIDPKDRAQNASKPKNVAVTNYPKVGRKEDLAVVLYEKLKGINGRVQEIMETDDENSKGIQTMIDSPIMLPPSDQHQPEDVKMSNTSDSPFLAVIANSLMQQFTPTDQQNDKHDEIEESSLEWFKYFPNKI